MSEDKKPRFVLGQPVEYKMGFGCGRGVIVSEPRTRNDSFVYDVRTRSGNVRAFGEKNLSRV